MTYDREPRYLHPYIANRLQNILDAIDSKLPVNHNSKLISAHRTPADQFNLFKQGRTFRNGTWARTGSVVTNLDGYIKMSRHNYLPCTAFDTGIFQNGTYLPNSPLYQLVKEGNGWKMDWGGDWITFKDQPHLEMPKTAFFKNNIDKDNALVWQQYLQKAGAYSGAMDGIFGPSSIKALQEVTGQTSRNLQAWDALYSKYGQLDGYA